ncbi:MAG: hypothetical protein HZC02_04065 [Candidatus Levybacteria bacterium]|nr:hypothetical protein [Candidatus Levybacteria bacterium]
MRSLGLSESQVIDVFNNGIYVTEATGNKTAIKKIGSCEIGCQYDLNMRTGQYLITDVWKKSI